MSWCPHSDTLLAHDVAAAVPNTGHARSPQHVHTTMTAASTHPAERPPLNLLDVGDGARVPRHVAELAVVWSPEPVARDVLVTLCGHCRLHKLDL